MGERMELKKNITTFTTQPNWIYLTKQNSYKIFNLLVFSYLIRPYLSPTFLKKFNRFTTITKVGSKKMVQLNTSKSFKMNSVWIYVNEIKNLQVNK